MKTKRRSRTESMADPDSTVSPLSHHNDIVKDILSRLPIKSIKRFESVSKLWYSLINSDDFISGHLRRCSRRPSLLIHRFHNPTSLNFAISLIDNRTTMLRDIRIPFLSSLNRFPKIVGSCNGILCLDISPCYASAFVLWNISTRQFRLIPGPVINDSRKPIWMVATGFGYSPEINDYKLVRIVNFNCKSDESHIVRAEVFSWITGSWRLIDGSMTDEKIGSCVIHEGQHAVTVNGSLCWVANGFAGFATKRRVICFDLGTEEFRQIAIPDFSGGICCKVVKFKESLGLAVYPAMAVYPGYGRSIDRIELWILDENCSADGRSMKWSKLHIIELNASGFSTPIGVYNDTELLVKRVDTHCITLCFFDPYNNSTKNLSICSSDYTCEFYSYVDSLVPVANAADEQVEEEAEAQD